MQLSERRQGNAAYRAGRFSEALEHYTRARGIVELVRGLSRADQAEVDLNRVSVECNIAAVHLTTKDYGAAVEAASRALTLDPTCIKALSRRAKAAVGRHEYESAASDIAMLRTLGPQGVSEAEALEANARRAKMEDKAEEKMVFGNMFGRSN